MHAIPEKLSALRQSLEATMIRQNVETRQELEQKLRDSCKEAEDQALQRAEELLTPQIRSMTERLQALIQAVQMRSEEAFPKISEVADQLSATRAEVQPLHQRADVAAARLDRVAVETSTTSKDCQDLAADFKDVVADLRARLVEEGRKREAVESCFKALLGEALQSSASATRAVQDRADDQAKDALFKLTALEDRLGRRVEEAAERSLKELKLGDEDVTNRLRPEIQALHQLVHKKSEDSQEHAEVIVRNAVSTLRTELESGIHRAVSNGDRSVEQKAREIMTKMNEGLEAGVRRCEAVREGCGVALHEATTVLRKSVTDNRAATGAEVQALRQLISSTDDRIVQVSEATEQKAVDAAARRLDDTAADIRKELSEAKQLLLDADEAQRQSLRTQIEEAIVKIERGIEDKSAAAHSHQSLSLRQAIAQIQSELADALKVANDRTDLFRCQAAEALSKEVQARREAVLAAESTCEALVGRVRDDAKKADGEAIAQAVALTDKADRRVDATNDAIKALERSLQAVEKEHADTAASLRNQLRVERQRAEETAAQASNLTQEVRDNLEAHLQNEATELRAGLADARKKIYEEANALRAELRDQPTKRELVELASTTTEQYNELSTAIDGHRSRLEAAVANSDTRVREARGEASEARLRMQRETMTLGAELTTLRAAASSLANGLLKTLQVIGFLRDEVDCAAGKEAGNVIKASDGKEHHRGIEIEDLLEWEKVGKSLATRVARQWYVKESAGISTMLSMVERKVDSDELVPLKNLIRECSGKTMNETGSTMAPCSPASPKPAAEMPPGGVTKAREQRMVSIGKDVDTTGLV